LGALLTEKMPYPSEYMKHSALRDGTKVLIRPIKPNDAEKEREFILGLSEESAFFRFFAVQRDPSPEMIESLCNVDYENQMALVAEVNERAKTRFVGVGRITASTKNRAELAVVVSDDYHGKSIGGWLLTALLEFARDRKFASVYALILPENVPMINLARKLGFHIAHQEDKLVIAELPLSH
jgi:acetyltransferase